MTFYRLTDTYDERDAIDFDYLGWWPADKYFCSREKAKAAAKELVKSCPHYSPDKQFRWVRGRKNSIKLCQVGWYSWLKIIPIETEDEPDCA